MKTIRTEIEKLEKLFDSLNKHYYKNELPRPVIQYMNDPKGNRYGSISANKVWSNDDGTDTNYQLTIYANWKRPKQNIVATLLHEMAHLYALENNINDTSRRGRYHNANFRDIATAHGIMVTKVERLGWTETTPTAETVELCNKLGDIPSAWYNPITPVEGPITPKKPKAKWYTFVCADCGEVIKSKNPDLMAICSCGGGFIPA